MKNVEIMDSVLLALPGVNRDYKEEWGMTRYRIGEKMFAGSGGDKNGRPIVTLKLPPEECDFLRAAYPGQIVVGYYFNKQHWISIYDGEAVPDEVRIHALERSYEAFVATLPKKVRAALTPEPEA